MSHELLDITTLSAEYLGQTPLEYAPGYPRVAGLMACDENLAIFRKFNRMAYLSTLHQQSKLLAIEREIDEMDALDNEFIVLVPQILKSLGLDEKDLKQFRAEHGPSNTMVDNFEQYIRGVKTDDIRLGEPYAPLESQRWLEVVFKAHHGSVVSYVFLRGEWRSKVRNADEFKIALVFRTGDSTELPMVLWQAGRVKKQFALAASWNFRGADIVLGRGTSQSAFFVGEGFQEQIRGYLATHGAFRCFVSFDTASPTPNISSAVAIISHAAQTTAGIITLGPPTVRKLYHVSPDDIALKKRMISLRDRFLMTRSSIQEDITRVSALNRLETQLAAYRSILTTNAQMSHLEAPKTRGLAALRHWFRGGAGNKLVPSSLPLQDLSKGVYAHRKHVKDLAAVGSLSGRGFLSCLTKILLPRLFKIAILVSVVGAFLGVSLLISAIVGLDPLDI
ncbi:hypothetical protein T440DRAFT_517349 [Plenodomus tracheiphilus IPT5]|uniref:DUF6594 domain-containing protein n=1 Tax=Plenodomus tracheiphilus IPT5 TaxID=1408161 RepID=A0A6A7B7R3_9PLEO|nr:hypothetical protein T440DRAFT_517349 [Plenodomus tracheiphilus IPT5]